VCDGQGGKEKVVGEKDQPQILLRAEVRNAPQRIGIEVGSLGSSEKNRLIGPQAGGAIDGSPPPPIKLRVLFGAGDEEGATFGQRIEAGEIQVGVIGQIKSSGFEKDFVQEVDIVNLTAGHINTGRNASAQIQQRAHLDGALAAAVLRPGEQRQTQIDGREFERVNGLGQLQAERLVAIKFASSGDQHLSEIGKDAPVATLVGVRQRVARDGTAQAHVIKLGALGAQTGFDVAPTFAARELRKSQTEKLIEAGKALNLAVASVTLHATAKSLPREEVHDLRKNPTDVHAPLHPCVGNGDTVSLTSNRFYTFLLAN